MSQSSQRCSSTHSS